MHLSVDPQNDSQDLLLAAIDLLEVRYQLIRSACLALNISGLYRRLSTDSIEHRQHEQWCFLSRLWWQRYCLLKGRAPNTLMPQQSIDIFDQTL